MSTASTQGLPRKPKKSDLCSILGRNEAHPEAQSHYVCIRCNYLQLSPSETDPTRAEHWLIAQEDDYMHFDRFTEHNHFAQFGYAVLTRPAVELLKRYSPILEVGAGTGYWAFETAAAGADIIATDPRPASMWPGQETWTNIYTLTGQEAVLKYPDRNLLMCWPETFRWPTETLRAFRGQYLLYVGEEREGCTGTNEMFDALENSTSPWNTWPYRSSPSTTTA